MEIDTEVEIIPSENKPQKEMQNKFSILYANMVFDKNYLQKFGQLVFPLEKDSIAFVRSGLSKIADTCSLLSDWGFEQKDCIICGDLDSQPNFPLKTKRLRHHQ